MTANLAFGNLNKALSDAPVLRLPNFEEEFVVECDASGSGVGAVLQQRGHPIAFFSRKLADCHHKLPVYEMELIGLAKAISYWRPYLWGRHFLIQTDHYSLKFLLEQQSTTSPHQHWIRKLTGFDFRVEYKAGRLDRVTDALSRQDEKEGQLFAISYSQADIFDALKEEIEASEDLKQLRNNIAKGETGSEWVVRDELILL